MRVVSSDATAAIPELALLMLPPHLPATLGGAAKLRPDTRADGAAAKHRAVVPTEFPVIFVKPRLTRRTALLFIFALYWHKHKWDAKM